INLLIDEIALHQHFAVEVMVTGKLAQAAGETGDVISHVHFPCASFNSTIVLQYAGREAGSRSAVRRSREATGSKTAPVTARPGEPPDSCRARRPVQWKIACQFAHRARTRVTGMRCARVSELRSGAAI